MIKSLFAVIIGGSVGCTLRWLLSTRFNSLGDAANLLI